MNQSKIFYAIRFSYQGDIVTSIMLNKIANQFKIHKYLITKLVIHNIQRDLWRWCDSCLTIDSRDIKLLTTMMVRQVGFLAVYHSGYT